MTSGLPGTYSFDEIVRKFRAEGRIVIVGASLAGLRAAEALREMGFEGSLTIIGDEPHEPYDRPPLSKQVLKGWVPADHTKLPRLHRVDADWRLGVAAVSLDRVNHIVKLGNGEEVGYDRLLIATGTRARPWSNPEEAALQGVFTVRTVEDATGLSAALKAQPRRVLIIGSGFVGSEIASVCRDLDLPVTVIERGSGPLKGALGGVISDIAAQMMRDARARDFDSNVPSLRHLEGTRGGSSGGIPIHSVRLPGFVASQEVIFGGTGQTLTLRHDSTGRDSFMPGVVIAVREVMRRDALVEGLASLVGLG